VISVVIEFDKKGHVSRFDVSGHAGYDTPGKDIVCAAVSAVVQAAVIGLTDVVGLNVEYRQKNGSARCIIPKGLNIDKQEKADIVLKTMVYGLKSIQSGYSEYITVLEKEAE
jgi:uncharacterized protein YsxB (DUF464 family)